MDILMDAEIDQLVAGSKLAAKYAKEIDSDSAYEILTRKLEQAAAAAPPEEEKPVAGGGRTTREPSFFDNPVVKQVGRTAASVITRSLLGALGLTGRSRRR
jgi:hypothetical protein